MNKLIALLILTSVVFNNMYAQNAVVKGVITDTTSKKNLANTVISLLRSKDSVLYKYTRSKEDGSFILNNIDTGKYEVFVSHHTYADYADHIIITDNSVIDLKSIMLSLKANLLKDVTVRTQIAAIRMRGDTTEFTADSFQVRPGATVEDMLKKLPGFTIDKDGKITAQGSSIEKVLVDGEEFFGDDPTVATRNLQASDIDKVQLFDKKSDQATFTGIDDGLSKKTLNLKMKEDKKKGYFGKIDLAGGLQDKWSNSAMFNRFRAKRKLSVYGIMSSVGKTGLNWQESNTYGSGNNVEYNDDDGIYFSFGNDDDLNTSNYYGEGLPKSWSAGINYSDKFNNDKQNFNGSYRYNQLNTEGQGNTLSRNILEKDILITKETRDNFNSKTRHSVNGTYEWNIDSSTSLKFTGSGYTGTTNGVSNYTSETTNKLDSLINKSIRSTSAKGDNQNVKANLLLRKKFKKMGRTFSLSLDEQYNAASTTGYLNALVTTFNDLGKINDSTDQRKINDGRTSVFMAKAVYTEPLSKKVFMEINYGIRNSTSNSERLTYDKSGSGKYDVLNDTFSNKYRFNVLTHTTGLNFKYNGKKLTASLGSDVAFHNFRQTDLLNDTLFKRTYNNLFPRANISYKFSTNTRLNINYNGSTNQPTINQIQPVADNSNPLNITIGNSGLKQEFRHNIGFNFNSYKVMSQRGIYIYGNVAVTNNAIVTNQYTNDTTGKTINQYVNANGNYNTYMGSGYNMKLKKLDMFFNSGLNFNASRNTRFVNGIKNVTNNYAPGINIGLGKDKEKKYNLYYSARFNYNFSQSSINTGIQTNYWTMNHSLYANLQLPWKMEINTDIDYNLRQRTDLFTSNNNVFLWNAYIGRKLLKNDKAIIKFSANDLLNQAKGYSRYAETNISREDNYQTINRYFLLSFTWNFAKGPGTGATP